MTNRRDHYYSWSFSWKFLACLFPSTLISACLRYSCAIARDYDRSFSEFIRAVP